MYLSPVVLCSIIWPLSNFHSTYQLCAAQPHSSFHSTIVHHNLYSADQLCLAQPHSNFHTAVVHHNLDSANQLCIAQPHSNFHSAGVNYNLRSADQLCTANSSAAQQISTSRPVVHSPTAWSRQSSTSRLVPGGSASVTYCVKRVTTIV